MSSIDDFLDMASKQDFTDALICVKDRFNSMDTDAAATIHEFEELMETEGGDLVGYKDYISLTNEFSLTDVEECGERFIDMLGWLPGLAPFSRVAWLYAHAFDALRKHVSDWDRFNVLLEELIDSMEGWNSSGDDTWGNYLDVIIECYLEINNRIAEHYNMGSREIVGVIVLLSRSGKYLHRLEYGKKRIPHDYHHIVKMFDQVKRISEDKEERWCLEREVSNSLYEDRHLWPYQRFYPALVLVNLLEYWHRLHKNIDWYDAGCPGPKEFLILRDGFQVLDILSENDCHAIERDIL